MKVATAIQLTDIPADASAKADFDALYDRYGALVLRWATHLGGPTLDAEEIAQEVFFRAYCAGPVPPSQVHPCTRLYRLTAGVVAGRRARERRKERIASLLRTVRHAPDPTPLESLEEDQRRRVIYEVLGTMRERDRTLLIAFGIEGLSGREMADLFGVKLGTVWTWLSRARLDLRRRLVNRGLAPRAP